MALNYRCFKNRNTGQVIYAPAGRHGRYLTAIKKIVNYVRYNMPKYYVVHLVLTLSEAAEEIHHRHLHRVMQFIGTRLKRVGADFEYLAVKEIQKERLEKHGEKAVHYHVLCVYSKPYVFPCAAEIAKSWGLGNVKITAPKLRMKVWKIVNYIGKYIGKGYEYESLDFKRSFTASQIKQIYKLSPNRLHEVVERFGKERAESFACTNRKVFVVGSEVAMILGTEVSRPFRKLIMEFASDWAYAGVYEEPY